MDSEPAAGLCPAFPPKLTANPFHFPQFSHLKNGTLPVAAGLPLSPLVPDTGFGEEGVWL